MSSERTVNWVGEWLDRLGLGEYAVSFADNAIDRDVLAELTDDDLKDLGVKLGHRKKLLREIASLHADDVAPASSPENSGGTAGTIEAERRQLTIMFCDLVGSTGLSQALDPEDLRELNRAYQDACKASVDRYDGHIARYMGDGVLAYFGFPRAHEDDAERAIHAGFEVIAATRQLSRSIGSAHGVELAVRIGIATGPVVVGDLIGEGASQESAVVGETPNIAARLQAIAAPNELIIGPVTRRLVGARFECVDLGAQTLKGIADPVGAWRVTSQLFAGGRFEAAHGGGATPLVAREHEVGLLTDRWEQAKEGDGQVVLLSGEAGIGKSRITRALLERIGDDRPARIDYQCSPYHANTPLHPIIEQLGRAARFESHDTNAAKIEKLESLLAQSVPDIAVMAPLLATVLSIPPGDRYAPLKLTPAQQKDKTLQALVMHIEGLSAQAPAILIFEDVQWADPTTLEFLAAVIARSQDLRWLVLVTFRPEFSAPWTGHAHTTSLMLNRLGRRQVAAMIEKLMGGKALPKDVLAEVVAKTDGVPLFVEELTKTVVESDLLVDAGAHYERRDSLPSLAIPSTLRDSLMARLDRLAPSIKQIAQAGAVIGREFSRELLIALHDGADAELDAGLDRLVESGMIFRTGALLEGTYSFKHALVQDAAYQSLLKKRRRSFHARVAEALEARSARAGVAPELIAHHYTEAELPDQAIGYWQRAGEQAARRAANLEATEHYRKALDLIRRRPVTAETEAAELKLLTGFGPTLLVTKGWAEPEVGVAYERARELARQSERSAELVPSLVGLWLFHFARGELDVADEVTHDLFLVAAATNDSDLLMQAHHAAWPTPLLRGALDIAKDHVDKGLALYEYDRHKSHALTYLGHDPAVCAHGLCALVDWTLGFPEQAEHHIDAALEIARRLEHAPTQAHALWVTAIAQVLRGDTAAALAAADELRRVSREHKLVPPGAIAEILSGWVLGETGQADEAEERMREGVELWERTGTRAWLPVFKCLWAEQLLRCERITEAKDVLEEARALGRQTGERWWESAALDLQARAFVLSGDRERAEERLRNALAVARSQSAKSWELRAATHLAGLWAGQGKRDEAYNLLKPIHDGFTEGHETTDLAEAKRLIEELQ